MLLLAYGIEFEIHVFVRLIDLVFLITEDLPFRMSRKNHSHCSFKKYKTKHNPKISILRNPRYGLKKDEK